MRVLITGAAGQDGTLMSTLLSRDGARVVGLVKTGTPHRRLLRYVPRIEVVEGDLGDTQLLRELVRDVQPTHIYNFGGFTAPGESWDHQEEVHRINVDAVHALLEGVRVLDEPSRFFQASSAQIFEGTDRSPQNEAFELSPINPYAKSKAEALQIVRDFRERHRLFAVSAILYNHESPLRSDHFVTRKVSMAVARVAAGLQDVLELGDIEVARDWGWAPDYVRAMRLMTEAEIPQDYVLATGISHRLSFFVAKAFAAAGIPDWRAHVRTSGSDRPVDTNKMVGDPSKAYRELGWRHTVDFDGMAASMVDFDRTLLTNPEALWEDF
jgi:GDPmannose 4,6-dehydratase